MDTDDVHCTEISQMQSSCIGVRLEPSIFVPICQENTDSASCRFWIGDDREKELLASNQCVLVEVEDTSRLVFDDDSRGNTSENETVSEENVKIFVPVDVAREVGYSTFAQLGPVTECSRVHTFVYRKVSSEEEVTPGETALIFNDEVLSVRMQLNGNLEDLLQYKVEEAWENEVEEVRVDKFTWSMLPKIIKGSAAKLLSQKGLVISALIGRIGFCGLKYYYNVFKNNSETQLISDGQSYWSDGILSVFYIDDLVDIAQKLYHSTSVFMMRLGNLL